ncbi:hypothetical protein KBA63_02370 [Candidatus Woesebacteria bacterium]|nr:hypothetical protein [Candidatus Woesebacteria bacterium]MBP9687356.1 hypothetical protein [Candidatus Woesebacteria bacterium]
MPIVTKTESITYPILQRYDMQLLLPVVLISFLLVCSLVSYIYAMKTKKISYFIPRTLLVLCVVFTLMLIPLPIKNRCSNNLDMLYPCTTYASTFQIIINKLFSFGSGQTYSGLIRSQYID